MTVTEVRAFNRFYTGVIGVLDRGYLDSPYSLTEVRVLYELAHTPAAEVVALRRDLGLDAGYLSRMLTRFERAGLVARSVSPSDARKQLVELTEAGQAEFAELDRRSSEEISGLLAPLSTADRERLVAAMHTIERVLRPGDREIVLRGLRPGDLGWLVHRHGARYAEEFGYDVTFEQLVAQVVADFRPGEREAGWIAEVGGEPVGSIFCVAGDDRTAKLRLLLVEPSARGLGVGTRLVDECLRFAREAGYERMVLWTVKGLDNARRIYERAGFQLVDETPQHRFGLPVVGQNWELHLIGD
ncbi:MarR family transcriptional regulator [Lentzea sp. NBRC 105346]|uniref:bifunctional helix-turn-helix transcriptional regulator/GNAT family N-acetyltransferase n=1 Tax=Lentzea sp. NBRC 105346 TaxID=3032205 RepID=UPI0024A51572|nr:helix-turn-helix domain-containing GNAT family N-acetyltransferase [Lentzea sp. NBRC 105346]GLZ31626.1 MarR family transcriptional regulator [Lentzea sp. NBRC 105346]